LCPLEISFIKSLKLKYAYTIPNPQYPHHSWQSWKDYAVKKLLPALGKDNLEEIRKHARELNPEQQFELQGSDSDTEPIEFFSHADIMIASDYILNKAGNALEPGFFDELATQYPHHSSQSWTEFASNTILKNTNVIPDSTGVQTEDQSQSSQSEEWTKYLSMDVYEEYSARYQSLLKDYDLWDENEIKIALFMASGYINLAKCILDVGFVIEKLPKEISMMIFTRDQDQLIQKGESNDAYLKLEQEKGTELLADRSRFLEVKNLVQ
jgi:hypothetical protein